MNNPLQQLRELRAIRDRHPKCETCDHRHMCNALWDEEAHQQHKMTSEEVRARFYCQSHSKLPMVGNESEEDREAQQMDLFLNYGGPWEWDPTAVLVTGEPIVPPLLSPFKRPPQDDEEDT